jgi:hypothetical protein
MAGRREDEGVELLRNALVCLPLFEKEDTFMELYVLQCFTHALFDTHAIDEAEPLVSRYLEAAKAFSDKQGRLSYEVLHSLYASARLHEVLRTCTPRYESPLTLLGPCIPPRPIVSVTASPRPHQDTCTH